MYCIALAPPLGPSPRSLPLAPLVPPYSLPPKPSPPPPPYTHTCRMESTTCFPELLYTRSWELPWSYTWGHMGDTVSQACSTGA